MASLLEEAFESLANNKSFYLFPFRYKKQVLWSDLFSACPQKDKRRRVDFYYPDLKLIVELNGIQHYKTVNFFSDGDSRATFEKQKDRDQTLCLFSNNEGLSLLVLNSEKQIKDLEKMNTIVSELF